MLQIATFQGLIISQLHLELGVRFPVHVAVLALALIELVHFSVVGVARAAEALASQAKYKPASTPLVHTWHASSVLLPMRYLLHYYF